MRKYLCSFLLFTVLSGFPALCQENNLDALDAFSGALLKKIRKEQGENASLTINKTIYTSGENVWFRTFLLSSVSQKISTKSKHLFVDLVDERDSVLSKSLLSAGNQQTSGKLLLPDTLSTGTYWIRAYTTTMIKKDPNSAAVLPLYVINPANPAPAPSNQKIQKGTVSEKGVGVEMFPEGGSLVTGINNTIGFYVHDKGGNPLELTGHIKDNRDSVVSTFQTNSLGLSKAAFSPFHHRKYRAVVSYKNEDFSFPLPPFNRFAGQLSAGNISGNTLKLRTILEDSIYAKDAVTYLVGLSRDSLCFASIGYGSYETDVPLSKFPTGIASFLLFDKNFKLLSERSVFVKENHLKISASLDRDAYAKRSKAILSTSVLDRDNQPLSSSLTVSVVDSSAVIEADESIRQRLIQKAKETGITSLDLSEISTLSEQDIDLLLMRNRSLYNDFLAQKNKTILPSNDSLFFIGGKLLNSKSEPLANRTLNLISRGGNGIFLSAQTDAAGRFSFPLSEYPDSTQFMIEVSKVKGKAEMQKIELEKFLFPRFQTPADKKQGLSISAAKRMAYVRKYADTTSTGDGNEWLKPVRLDATSKSERIDPRRMSSSGSVLTREELMKLGVGNIGFGLLRMPGVQLLNGFVRFYGPDQFSGATADSEPMVVLDGSQISLSAGTGGSSSSPVIQYLNSLNPREVDFIEVLKGPEASLFGMRGGEGVISIHTTSRVHQEFESKDGSVFTFYRQGYAKPAPFPFISYEQKRSSDLALIDQRSTLYWNENELTDSEGKSFFTFFTNDVPGRYKVFITGITVHGDPFRKTLSFTNR